MLQGLNFNVPVPASAPNGEAIFAWTWINAVGNREYYMNCADVIITGGTTPALVSGPRLFVANLPYVQGAPTIPEFPDPSSTNDGRNYLADRPIIQVTGSGSSGSGSVTTGSTPITTAPPTTGVRTTGTGTTAPMTTGSVTTARVTTAARTTGPVTTGQATTAPITTGDATEDESSVAVISGEGTNAEQAGEQSASQSRMSNGAVAGLVIGVAIGVLALTVLGAWIVRRRDQVRSRSSSTESTGSNSDMPMLKGLGKTPTSMGMIELGTQVIACYTGDNQPYAATITKYGGNGRYFVEYGPKFNNEGEWLSSDRIRVWS